MGLKRSDYTLPQPLENINPSGRFYMLKNLRTTTTVIKTLTTQKSSYYIICSVYNKLFRCNPLIVKDNILTNNFIFLLRHL